MGHVKLLHSTCQCYQGYLPLQRPSWPLLYLSLNKLCKTGLSKRAVILHTSSAWRNNGTNGTFTLLQDLLSGGVVMSQRVAWISVLFISTENSMSYGVKHRSNTELAIAPDEPCSKHPAAPLPSLAASQRLPGHRCSSCLLPLDRFLRTLRTCPHWKPKYWQPVNTHYLVCDPSGVRTA